MTTKLTKAQQTERDEAIERLREEMPAGTTVFTQLRHVSRSGMRRVISVHTIPGAEDIRVWSYYVARALDLRLDDNHNGVKVDGAGMDMGYHVVHSLSRVLYGDGYVLNHRWI